MPLLVIGTAGVLGVLAGSWAAPPLVLLRAIAVGAGVAAVLLVGRRTDRISALALAVFALGIVRYDLHLQDQQARHLSSLAGSPVTLTAVVDQPPDRRSRAQRLTVSVRSIRIDGVEQPLQGSVLVTLQLLPERQYGDVLRLSGKLETPPVLEGFDYGAYLARQGIRFTTS